MGVQKGPQMRFVLFAYASHIKSVQLLRQNPADLEVSEQTCRETGRETGKSRQEQARAGKDAEGKQTGKWRREASSWKGTAASKQASKGA